MIIGDVKASVKNLGLQDANSSDVAYNGKAEPEKKGAVLNLFDMIVPGNFLSLNDKKGAVLRCSP